jgi:hypothetical protein
LSTAACFPESAFCPAAESAAVVLDLTVGHFWLTFTVVGGVAAGGGVNVVSATLPTSAGGGPVGGGAVVGLYRLSSVIVEFRLLIA